VSARRFAALAGVILAFAACERRAAFEILTPPAPPDQLQQTYWPLADFSLTERSGRTVTSDDLKGKVWVADFFFTSCPGLCIALGSRLTELQKQFGDDDRVRLVSISCDPETDTVEVLRRYAEKLGARERWLFLTGPKPAIQELAEHGFKLPLAEAPGAAEPILHSSRLILVDRSGNLRGLYEATGDEGPERLARDLRRLLETQP
jgi:protein SCO1/2